MDEVVTDFKSWALSIDPNYNQSKEYFLQFFEENYNDAFINQEPLDLWDDFLEMYISNSDVKFLTSLPPEVTDEQFNICKNNKLLWLKRQLPGFDENDLIVVRDQYGKLNYCNPGDTLYDDKIEIIDEWNRLGGIGIHTVGKPI
jgi:hypothetical protein